MRQYLPLVGPMERALHLRSLPFLRELEAAELAACAQLVEEVQLRRGAVLYGPREGVPAVYLVVDGHVQLERGGLIVDRLGPPHMVGLVELLAGGPTVRRGVAETNLIALAIDSGELFDLLEDRFPVFLQARRALAEQVARLQANVNHCPAPRAAAIASPFAERLGATERLLMLRRTPLLHGIGLAVLAALTDDDSQVAFSAGEPLWHCGDEAKFLAVVVRGNIRCTSEDSRLAFGVAPGGIVGADAACGGGPHRFGAVAEEDASVLRIDTSLLIDLAEDHFDLGLRMLAHLAGEVLRLEDCSAIR